MHELTIVGSVLGIAVLISSWLGVGHHQQQKHLQESRLRDKDVELQSFAKWDKYKDLAQMPEDESTPEE